MTGACGSTHQWRSTWIHEVGAETDIWQNGSGSCDDRPRRWVRCRRASSGYAEQVVGRARVVAVTAGSIAGRRGGSCRAWRAHYLANTTYTCPRRAVVVQRSRRRGLL